MSGADAASGIETHDDIVYAPRDGLALDLILPAGATEPVPVAVYFHGGGWARGDRKRGREERLFPVARAGVAVASVSYRLSGEATWPAQLEDARDAVRFLAEHAGDYGLDTDRIGAWGASAGGHIAFMLGFAGGAAGHAAAGRAAAAGGAPAGGAGSSGASAGAADGADAAAGAEAEETAARAADESAGHEPRVSRVVAWFPPSDLAALATEERAEGVELPPFIDPAVGVPPFEYHLVGAEPGSDARDALAAVSPLSHAHGSGPATLLVHGERDGLFSSAHSRRLHDRLTGEGATSQLLLVADANHEDPVFDAPAVLGATAAWLAAAR